MSLAAHALDFGHPGAPVGRALDLSLEAGEVLCVLGPNGAGKTTLFRTLLGLIPPLGGRVCAGGRDLATLSRAEIARRVAYVPQASGTAFAFTIAEIVEMGRSAHLGAVASPSRPDRERAREALGRLGLEALSDRPMNAVSGGERQLALIARALATEAGTIVMDEPTANLDLGNQARVLGEIARLQESGIAVLFSTHDPDQAFQVANRALLLRGGQCLAQGAANDVLTEPNLSSLYSTAIRVSEVDLDGIRHRVCVPGLATRH